jgi:hypothetical protein
MDYTIYPYEGVGPIRLGMTQQEIRAILGEPEKTFLRPPNSKYPTDFYIRLGLQITYKDPGVCNAIHTTNGEVKPVFQCQLLTDQPYSELKSWFQKIDEKIEEDSDGLTSYKHGIALYAPKHTWEPEDGLDEDTDMVEGVLVFERGYYDGRTERMAAHLAELDRRIDAGLPFDDLLMGY